MKTLFNNYEKLTRVCILLVFLVFISSDLIAQKTVNITGYVYDSLNLQPLGLVKVYNLTKKTGTSTTFQGVFKLENVSRTDSISFYSIGSERKIVTAEEVLNNNSKIYLCPEALIIEEAFILADRSILYELVSKCKNRPTTKDLVSKVYMEVKSTNDTRPIELIQGYYNGYFNGYNQTKVVTKNVRIGLQAQNQRLYTSVKTTGVFYEHNLFEQNELFPVNPLQLKKKELIKKYGLFLASKFRDKDKVMYVIGFSPIENNQDYFSGTIWIDSNENKIHKIILEIQNARKHPFDPFWNSEKLNNVNLKISKGFSHQNDTIRTDYVDFEYEINYANKVDSSITIKTHSTLHAYNYREQFIEPFFEFPTEKYWLNQELTKLAVIEYDSLFWECQDEFRSSSDKKKNDAFYNDQFSITGPMLYQFEKFWFLNANEKSSNLRSIYTNWSSENRIFIKEMGSDTSVIKNPLGAPPAQLYHLEAQLYLNINEGCDSVYYSTKTIYDPFKTYYHYPFTQETLIFINIYFDIIEIQRRKLELKLATCENDVSRMKLAYAAIMKETTEISKKFFNEVNRGYNTTELIRWNEYVVKNLNINNLELYKVSE